MLMEKQRENLCNCFSFFNLYLVICIGFLNRLLTPYIVRLVMKVTDLTENTREFPGAYKILN